MQYLKKKKKNIRVEDQKTKAQQNKCKTSNQNTTKERKIRNNAQQKQEQPTKSYRRTNN